MTATAEATAPSLFERIGGTEGVRTVVERFYDLMQDDVFQTIMPNAVLVKQKPVAV